MVSNKRNYLFTILVIIAFLFILSVLIVIGIKRNFSSVSPDDVTFDADSNTVIIKSLLTVSDEFGKTISDDNGGYYGYLEFSVTNNTDKKRNYQIYIQKNDINIKEIDENYVKFYLTDFNDHPFNKYSSNILPDYGSLNFLSDKPGCKLLYSSSLNGVETKRFKLRVWISDTYNISDEENAFTFVISARAV